MLVCFLQNVPHVILRTSCKRATMYIPLLGRISVLEWPVIIISFILSWLEYVISIITNTLPREVIDFFTTTVSLLYKLTPNPITLILSSQKGPADGQVSYKYFYKRANLVHKGEHERMVDILNAADVQEICQIHGYDVENRIVRTKDDYLLTIQRITRPGEPRRRSNGRVVYFHHGLLMSCEVWVTMVQTHQNLPFLLYDLGYDVWLGNNRGNKYCQKHLNFPIKSERFWNFSIDEFAMFDIPNSIDYILHETGAKTLTYIGFSQGTAQAFAAVSINPDLNKKVEQIIAISPATTPHGLYSRFLDILLKSSPNIVYLLFSRKTLMPSVFFWQQIMYPPFFDTMIDISNYILFNWRAHNITKLQKLCSYAHLYSTTSVKTVVHWFQIIGSKKFHMYRDNASSIGGSTLITYPLKSIKIPIHLIYGTTDSLVDIDVMLSQLPTEKTTAQPVENHEHLDNIWGYDVKQKVFSHVLNYLDEAIHASPPLPVERIEQSYLKAIGSGDESSTLYNDIKEVELSYRKPSASGSLFL